jgi:negative regulator of sigma E activity
VIWGRLQTAQARACTSTRNRTVSQHEHDRITSEHRSSINGRTRSFLLYTSSCTASSSRLGAESCAGKPADSMLAY